MRAFCPSDGLGADAFPGAHKKRICHKRYARQADNVRSRTSVISLTPPRTSPVTPPRNRCASARTRSELIVAAPMKAGANFGTRSRVITTANEAAARTVPRVTYSMLDWARPPVRAHELLYALTTIAKRLSAGTIAKAIQLFAIIRL